MKKHIRRRVYPQAVWNTSVGGRETHRNNLKTCKQQSEEDIQVAIIDLVDIASGASKGVDVRGIAIVSVGADESNLRNFV